MPKLTVRALTGDDWDQYRAIRLAALQEAPSAFLHTWEEEQEYDETRWRSEMEGCRRLVVEHGGQVVGVATVQVLQDEAEAADVSGLWVAPEARHLGAALRLIEAAAAAAAEEGSSRLYYWVGSENGRAIGFALNAGFRPSSRRRTSPTTHPEFGDQEIALVLSLASDPAAIPNATPRSLRRTA